MLLQATERAEAGDFAQAAELSQQLLAQDETNTSALFLCHHLNREQFELFVYANNEREDKLKADFEAFATWRCHHRRRVLDGCAGAMP